jgi:Domain of unknown function (DUF4105)
VRDVLAAALIALCTAWGALALRYQAPGGNAGKAASVTLWALFGVGSELAVFTGRLSAAAGVFALGHIALLIWWRSLKPSNERPWADDVAEMVRGSVAGSQVTLTHVRNFVWRTPTDYTPHWVTRSYDLDRLRSLDLIVSYWTGPAIAHMLLSFGFTDGRHIVFSVEIRREKSEEFSEVGGFFKEFELSIIASEERDIVRLRTNVRREDTYLYRLKLSESAMRSLFLAYVEEANSLARTPRFYHTITANCTTLVYLMLRRILKRLPFSYRVLLSGYLPQYVYAVGGLDQRHTLEELRTLGYISERARRVDQSETFSQDIREGVPSL